MEKSFFYEKLIDNIKRNILTPDEIEKVLGGLIFEKNLFSVILDSIDEGIIVCDKSNKYLYSNRKANIFFNNLKRDNIELVLPEQVIENFKKVKKGKRVENFIVPIKLLKTNYLLEFNIIKVKKSTFEVYLIVFYDINAKLKQTQESTINEAIKNIMELTYSVAHEIRNPLTALDLNLKLLQNEINRIDEENSSKCIACKTNYGEKIDLIRSEVIRLNRILEKFLNTAKPLNPRPELININDVVKEIFNNLSVQFELSGKKLILKLKEDLTLIFTDKNLLKQAIINLVKNGFDAIENKKNGFVEILTYEREEFIIIEVKDNGCGISEENKSKIFNPFFTTKPTGTGLGLSLVYKIIMAIGGEMEFKSKKGAGTSFYIKFNKNKLSSKLLLTKQQ